MAHVTKKTLIESSVRNLGVLLYSYLHFEMHICKSSNLLSFMEYFLNLFIPELLDTEAIIHAFISWCLDYCIGLLTGMNQITIQRLQIVQNAAATLLRKNKKEIISLSMSLPWFITESVLRLYYFKALCGLATWYICITVSLWPQLWNKVPHKLSNFVW